MDSRRHLSGSLALSFGVALSLTQACSSDEAAPAAPDAGTTTGQEGGIDGGADVGTTAPTSFTERSPGVLEAKVTISAANGGRVELPGGAVFEVAPGALASDREVTIRVPKSQTNASHFQSFHFEPTGLTFSKPATLRVPYGGFQGEPPIVGWSSGDFNALVGSGSELTDRAPMKMTRRDPASKTVDFEIPHFTFFNVLTQVDELLYVVPQIPAKYLLPGDMVFVLTAADEDKGPHWNPGHVGVFAGGGKACTPGGDDRVIESTTVSSEAVDGAVAAREQALKNGKPLPPVPQSGVQNTSLAAFRVDHGHFYLGARRPADGPPLSPTERTSVVQFCDAQIGKSYNIIGQGNINESSWSCVGLAEGAYDSIGRGSMGSVREAFGGTPIELYWNTKPVEEITMGVGDSLEMNVTGTVVHPDSFWPSLTGSMTTEGWYCDAFPCGDAEPRVTMNITMEGSKPATAEFVKHGFKKRLNYVAPPADVNKSFDLVFKITAPIIASIPFVGPKNLGEETREAKLRINVVPCAAPTPPPACLAPEDSSEHRTACLAGGEDAEAAIDAALLALEQAGLHGHSNPFFPFAPILPDVDLLTAAAMLMTLTQEEYDAAFGNSHLPCGHGPFGFTLCGASAASAGPGEWVYVSARLQSEIPLADPNRHYQYAFVFDQDDNLTNNYAAAAPYTADYFKGTDRWYEAAYAPNTGWQLKTRNANQSNQVTTFSSAARVILSGDTITLAVPKSEFLSAAPKFRITAFKHKGDFGIPAPHWYSADTYPTVDKPLQALPTTK